MENITQTELDFLIEHPDIELYMIKHYIKQEYYLYVNNGSGLDLSKTLKCTVPATFTDIIAIEAGKLKVWPECLATPPVNEMFKSGIILCKMSEEMLLYAKMQGVEWDSDDTIDLFYELPDAKVTLPENIHWIAEAIAAQKTGYFYTVWSDPSYGSLLRPEDYNIREYVYARLMYNELKARAHYSVRGNDLIIDFTNFKFNQKNEADEYQTDYLDDVGHYERVFNRFAPRGYNELAHILRASSEVPYEIGTNGTSITIRNFNKHQWRPIFEIILTQKDKHHKPHIADILKLKY